MRPALTWTYYVFDELKIIMMRNGHVGLVYVIFETFLLELAECD
jgi:hypothetical protein